MAKKKSVPKKVIAINASPEECKKFDLIKSKRGILTNSQVIRTLLNEECEKILS